MDGLWSGGALAEKIQQSKFVRHRLLIVSPGTNLGAPWPVDAASGFASVNPNNFGPGTVNPFSNRGQEGGPHFVMSGETPDESHTYGFEFTLFVNALTTPALAAVGGYTVTIWVLITNTQDPYGFQAPVWAAMAPQTGVLVEQLWHSFDVNAEAIRFQITNLADDPAANNESIGIAFSEL